MCSYWDNLTLYCLQLLLASPHSSINFRDLNSKWLLTMPSGDEGLNRLFSLFVKVSHNNLLICSWSWQSFHFCTSYIYESSSFVSLCVVNLSCNFFSLFVQKEEPAEWFPQYGHLCVFWAFIDMFFHSFFFLVFNKIIWFRESHLFMFIFSTSLHFFASFIFLQFHSILFFHLF